MRRKRIRQALRVVGAILFAVTLASCDGWLQTGYGPEQRRHNTAEDGLTIDNVASLEESWSTTFPGSITEPILDEGRVYVGTSEGRAPTANVGAVAFDADSGEELWRNEAEYPLSNNQVAQMVVTPAALSEGELRTGGLAGLPADCHAEANRLDPDTGVTLSSVPGQWHSAAVTGAGVVAYTSLSPGPNCPQLDFVDHRLVVEDATTHTILWSLPLGPGGHPLLMQKPTIAHDRLYLRHGGGLSAFPAAGCGAPTCAPLWTSDANAESAVVAEDGTVFAVASGTIYALDGDTGDTLWTAAAFGSARLALAHGTLFVSGDAIASNGPLYTYSAAGCGSTFCGSPLWRTEDGVSGTSHPAVAGGVVYVGVNGGVYAYDANGCGAQVCPALAHVGLTGPAVHISVGQGRLVAAGSDMLGQGTTHIAVFEPAG